LRGEQAILHIGKMISLLAIIICCFLYLLFRLQHYMTRIEPLHIVTPEYEVVDENLPETLDGLRICQISDLHSSRNWYNEVEISKALKKVNADLYVFTGDMIYMQEGVGVFLRWLEEMKDSLHPFILILGNAEHKPWLRDEEIFEGLKRYNDWVLINQSLTFKWKSGVLQVVGLDDPHTENDNANIAYANTDPNKWTLLLSHSPDGIVGVGERRADLTLSGHTHGGQIRLPFIGALICNTSKTKGFVTGWFHSDEIEKRIKRKTGVKLLYVSKGLGTGNVKARFLCNPEAPVFTLRRAPSGNGTNTIRVNA
jgi:predicted MPP superfamily phosphohydrolase